MDMIVLPGLAIDVILGMKWMSDHGVLIDTSTRTIMLREPKGGNAFLVPLPQSFDLQNLSCAIQATTLCDILVVCEFPDVFLDELPSLPPDRDVEFKIELVLGTAPDESMACRVIQFGSFSIDPKQIKMTHERELDSTLALSSRIFVGNNLVKKYWKARKATNISVQIVSMREGPT